MKLRRLLCLFVPLLALAANVARADFIVNVGDLSLQPNSSGLLPIYISSTAGQPLANTNFEFLITTAGPTRLEFASSPDPSIDPTFAAPNYVFSGNSADQAFDIALGTAATTSVPNDTFFGGDLTADSTDITGPLTNVLMAYLPVTTSLALPPVAGDTFTVSLIPNADSGANGISGFTGFSDSAGTYYPFTSSAGTVTIVPEPSSWTLCLCGAIIFFTILVETKRRARPHYATA
jgi:hypothetical protein